MKLSRFAWLAMSASLSLFAQIPDFTPPTPLFRAAFANDTAEVKRLLANGTDPNEGRFVFLGQAPIFVAIHNRNWEMFRALLERGADVKITDAVGSTTLMWAAANEHGSPEIVEALLRAGVNPNHKNQRGETALDWALRRGNTAIVAALLKAGATQSDRIKESVEKSIGLLQKSGPQFVRVSGCVSCHHQSLPQMAIGLARPRGFVTNQQVSQQQVAAVVAMFKAFREPMLKGTEAIPDPAITVSYSLLGLHAEGYAPDETTDAMAHLIATKQAVDGRFPAMPARPPMESSDFTATALSLRSLQLYGKNSSEAVMRAKHWLLQARPHTTEDRAMQILGLAWANAGAADLAKAARPLLSQQNADGGWSQLPSLESDAYATGQVLVALHQAGKLNTADPAYQRAVAFLLRTQLSDGSWLVRSRSFPIQTYKESGFPHAKDQWISASGTSWAAMALSLTATPPPHLGSAGL